MARVRKRRLRRTFGSALLAGVIASGFAASSASAATFTVSNLNDSGAGSLRQAIADANGAAGADDIDFGPGVTGTIQLQSELPNIFQPLAILGPGADQLTVRRAGTAANFRIFSVPGSAAVTLSGLTISNGAAIADFQPASEGGAIRSGGPLTIESSAITDNRGSIAGGIAAIGDLTLLNSTVSGNTVPGFGVGGVYALGSTTIVNSTITGNSAEGESSAGGVETFGSTQIRNSTIAGNVNPITGGTANLANLGSMLVTSTIVADPLGGGANCNSSGAIPSGGFNLESANSCGFSQISDQHNTDPRLGPLASNGGTTKTMAPAPTSAAVDRGSAAGTTTDQRGQTRPFDVTGLPNASDGSDVGAVESQVNPIIVKSLAGDFGANTLRSAITQANASPGADVIAFADGLNGSIDLGTALPDITGTAAIIGPGADVITVRRRFNSGNFFSVFNLANAASVTISGLTISGGSPTAATAGGINAPSASLLLEDSVVSDNRSTGGGAGGIGSGGPLTIRRTTIADNTALGGGLAGGVDAASTLTISTSTISGNTANGAGGAGGVRAAAATQISNSTIARNSNASPGAASNLRRAGGTVALTSSIVANPLGSGVNCTGAITSGGFNIDTENTCGFSQPGDQTNTSPDLGPLADNGGATPTMEPAANGPAIDRGQAEAGLDTDQRGQPRPFDQLAIPNASDGSDVGALERANDPIIVSNVADSGAGSLRAAMTAAESQTGPDEVRFEGTLTGTIQLQSALPAITQSLTIEGPGADAVTVRRSSGGDYEVFLADNASRSLSISGLTISNGKGSFAGGVSSRASLVLDGVAIVDNDRAGVFATQTQATIRNSTIADNTSSGSGAVLSFGAAITIENSTITGNTSEFGAAVTTEGTSTIAASTIAGNTNSGSSASGAANLRVVSGSLVVTSSIVADPLGTRPSCVASAPLISGGFNIDSGTSCGFGTTSDQPSTDPDLLALADNGGPTETMALPTASAAVDQGSPPPSLTADQRGRPRPFDFPTANADDGSDVGAFELGDADSDGLGDEDDNCPQIANVGQADNDGDAQGDVCDSDDDNDNVPDATDNCDLDPNPGQENNDGDAQGDVCDSDDDNDDVIDTADNCPLNANPGQENADGDSLGDICDSDDDDDAIEDPVDNCPLAHNPGQENTGGGPGGDACDEDDDGDGLPDVNDSCRVIASTHSSGCPLARTSLRIDYSDARDRFTGKVKSEEPACLRRMKVRIYRVAGRHKVIGVPKTNEKGGFSLDKNAHPGDYYVKYRRRVITDVVACGAKKSKVIDVG